MKIGSKNIKEGGVKAFRVKDMDMNSSKIIHVVNGPVKRVSHMWPTYAEDRTTGAFKPTWRSAIVNRDETNLLDKLAEIDISLKRKYAVSQKKDPKDIKKSTISKSDTYEYAVIVKNPGQPMECVPMECNWTVHKAIQDNKKKTHPQNPQFLLYGLPYMHDMVIQKQTNEKTRQPEYLVSPMNVHTEGKIDCAYIDEDKYPFENPAQFFTQAELDCINGTNWELESLKPVIGAAEVANRLVEFPINLGCRDKKNPTQFIFFNTLEDLHAIMQFAHAQNISITPPSEQELLTIPGYSAAPAGPMLSGPQTSAPAIPNAVEAQYTVESAVTVAPVAPVAQVAPVFQEAPVQQAAPVQPSPFAPSPFTAPAAPVQNAQPSPFAPSPFAAQPVAEAVPPTRPQPTQTAPNPFQPAPMAPAAPVGPAGAPAAFPKPNMW